MTFGELTPGTLARIPGVADLAPGLLARIPGGADPLITPTSALPPAVQVLTHPTPCRRRGCEAVEVMARPISGGRPRLYHRLPSRPVVLITIAQTEEV
ncbi:hypothetical protein ACFYY8_06440 [Streptosporangium sp. NPDC001559]|uniref:hypothetical protein n=1 Tax=Streptosporangium sp. NPDC001559 TaxID=3366187 RepID=UPI0036E19138